MESFSQSHKNLQMLCADFWPSAEDCQLILNDIGLTSVRINMAEPSIMRWLSIINELRRRDDGSMGRLVVVLLRQYPENQQLRDVCAPWTPAAPAHEATIAAPTGFVPGKKGDAPEKPAPDVEDIEEDALIVPRIDTLWDAMIDIEKRMIELEHLRETLRAALAIKPKHN